MLRTGPTQRAEALERAQVGWAKLREQRKRGHESEAVDMRRLSTNRCEAKLNRSVCARHLDCFGRRLQLHLCASPQLRRARSEADPDAPKHPGATFWDFVDARNLDPSDPVVPAAHQQALAGYRKAMAEYRAAKAARKAAAASADGDIEIVGS